MVHPDRQRKITRIWGMEIHENTVVVAAVGCLLAGTAAALPVKWDVQMTYGLNSVNGSFVYDADTNTYSDISIAYTHSTGLTGTIDRTAVYVGLPAGPDIFVASDVDGPDYTGQIMFGIEKNTTDFLTNTGGVVTRNADLLRCISANCNASSGGGGPATLTGTVLTAVVPVPAAGGLLLSAAAFLGWRRRR